MPLYLITRNYRLTMYNLITKIVNIQLQFINSSISYALCEYKILSLIFENYNCTAQIDIILFKYHACSNSIYPFLVTSIICFCTC